jgi:nucleoid-associated protein YgaU
MAMTRETKIGLLVGLAFIILFGIILSEKGTGRDQLATPSMSAYKPVVELIPPTSPPAAQLTRNGKSNDVADRLTMSEPGVKVAEQPAPAATSNLNNIAKPVEMVAPPVINPQPTPAIEVAPKLKPLLPPASTKGLTQIPAASPPVSDLLGISSPPQTSESQARTTEPKTEKQVVELKAHTIQQGETLASICRQYYPGQAYQMLKEVMELNKITKPEKLQQGQVIKLPAGKPVAVAASKVTKETIVPDSPGGIQSKLLVPVDSVNGTAATSPEKDIRQLLAEYEKEPVTAKTTPASAAKAVKTAKTTSKTYVVQSNDTLMKIARRLYGSEKAWTKIYEMNKKAISDPKSLKKGLKLNMPASVKNNTSTSELAAGPKVD